MEQATAIKSRFESIVIRKPGVSGVDLDASDGGDPVIRVYVQSRARAPELPSAVEGIRVEVVERSFDAP
jgi:hypothetical protein